MITSFMMYKMIWRDFGINIGLGSHQCNTGLPKNVQVTCLRCGRQPPKEETNMSRFEDRLATLEEENRKPRRMLMRRRRVKRREGNGQSSGRIWGYARVVTSKDEKSVGEQEAMIGEAAGKLGGQLVKVYCDAVAAARDVRWEERRGFRALMDVLEPGDHLIVWRLEEIELNPVRILEAMRWLVDRGISVHILEFGEFQLDLDRPMGRLLVMLWAVYARFFIEYPSSVTKQTVQWRRARGLAYNKVEIGKRRIWKMVPDPRYPGQIRRQGFDGWDAADCDIIREIWRRHEEGETLYSIAKDLKARDVRRWDGRPWVPDGCQRQSGSSKRYPLNPRNIQRVFWRYVAMLAVGQDLQGLPANPQHTELARDRIRSQRQGWTRTGQPGRLPKEVRGAIEQNDLEVLAEIKPRCWGNRLYPGPAQ